MIKKLYVQLLFLIFALMAGAGFGFGQSGAKSAVKTAVQTVSQANKSTAAYAEILLRKTELESTVESLLESYKEDYPKIKEARYELELIQKDYEKIIKESDASKLTLALGRLIVRKNELETDLWVLKNQYGEEHPQVVRAQRKAEIYKRAVSDIFP